MIDKRRFEKAMMKGALGSFLVFLAIFSLDEFISYQRGEISEFNGYSFGFTIFISIMFFVRIVLQELFVEKSDSKV